MCQCACGSMLRCNNTIEYKRRYRPKPKCQSSASARHSPDIPPAPVVRLCKLVFSLFDTFFGINSFVPKLSNSNQSSVKTTIEAIIINSYRFFFFCPSPSLALGTTMIESSSSVTETLVTCRVDRVVFWGVFSLAKSRPPRS